MATTTSTETFFPGFETGVVDADGVRIHYVVGGSGPPLLLIHGAPQSGVLWHHVANDLAQRYNLIIPDLRGYGRSGKPARGDYSKRRMAADLIVLMNSLGHDRFYVAGHDRGARVARRLVKDHQQRIIRAAVLDIVPTAYVFGNISKQVAVNFWHWWFWAVPEPTPEALVDGATYLELTGLTAASGDPDAYKDYAATNGNAESFHAMCEDYRAGASIDLAHDEADANVSIGIPLLVAWGRRSPTTGAVFDVKASWAGEGSDMTFRSIDSGHFMPEEKPAETSALLLSFFDEGQP